MRERESISYGHGRDAKDTVVNVCSERLESFLFFSSKGRDSQSMLECRPGQRCEKAVREMLPVCRSERI